MEARRGDRRGGMEDDDEEPIEATSSTLSIEGDLRLAAAPLLRKASLRRWAAASTAFGLVEDDDECLLIAPPRLDTVGDEERVDVGVDLELLLLLRTLRPPPLLEDDVVLER